MLVAICLRGLSLLAFCGVVMTTAAQDFHKKKAAPKARVITFSKSPTADRLAALQQTKADKAEKPRTPGVAFRDVFDMAFHGFVGKDEQAREPFAPTNARRALHSFSVSNVLMPMLAAANGEVKDEHGIIISPAEGVRKVYARSGMAYTNEDGFATVEQSGTVQIVECEDGTVYVRNILSTYPTGAWVKGTREGNTITIPSMQPIEYNAIGDVTFSPRWGVKEDIGFSNYDDYNGGNFTFTVDEEAQTISLEKSSEYIFMGLFWDDYGSFAWYGDYETMWTYERDYEPMPVVSVTVPDGLQTETWYVKGHYKVDEELQLYKGTVTLGFADGDVYVKGLFPDYPEAWMKGKVDGTDISFDGLQTLGANDGVAVYAVGCDNGDLAAFHLAYDTDAQTMTSTNALLANAHNDNLAPQVWFNDVTLSKDDPFAPIETLPYTNGFDTIDEWDVLTIIDANGDGSTWHQYDSGEGIFASYKYNSDNDGDDWIVTPAIRLEAGMTYNFIIDVVCSSNAYDERMEVMMGTAATAEAMTVTVIPPTELMTEVPVTQDNKLVTVPETGYYYFGIHAISDADHASLRVDNLYIGETILTAPAAVTDLTVTAAPETPVATISFTAPTKNIGGEELTANLTQIDILRDGDVIKSFEDVAPGTSMNYVDDDEELTGTIYHYQVVAYNADGPGEKSEMVTVRLNYVFSIPYVADFTQDAVGSQFIQIDANDDGSRWEWDGGTRAVYEYNSDNQADDYLVSPALHLDAGKKYNIYVDAGSAGYPERFEVVVGREPTVEGLNTKVLENCEVTLEDSKEFEGAFIAPETGVYHVAVHCISDADQYELWIHKVSVDFAPEGTAPAAPELTVTPGEKGAKEATVVIKAPETTVDGDALTGDITKIELWRGSDIVNVFEGVAPGATLTFVDADIEEVGNHTYQAIPYNADGIGLKSEKVTVYVGTDVPESVCNVQAVPQGDKVLLTWDKVPETGVNGGYVNPDEVEYDIYACYPNSTMYDDVVATVKGETSCEIDFATDEGDQGFQGWYVVARNEAGESLKDNESFVTVNVGEPYELPIVEGFAGGSTHYYWDSNSYPLAFSLSSDGDDVAMALTALQAGDIYLLSGKLNIKEADNPTLLFDAIGFGVSSLDVIGRIGAGDGVLLASETLEDDGYKTVKVGLNSLKEGSYAQVGITATITNPTVVDWFGDIEEEGDALVIDNIRIVDLVEHNLAAEVKAPATLQAGKTADIAVTVTNWGELAAKNYTVVITAGDEELMRETVAEELAPFAKREFKAQLATTVFDEAGSRTIRVQVDLDGEQKPADNSAETELTILASSAPAPTNLTAENVADGVALQWTAPAEEPAELTETFDNTDVFPTFSIGGITATQHAGSIGEWTLYDGNGLEVYSWDSDEINYEHRYEPSAWMVFDFGKVGFADVSGHSGTQMMLSMCPSPTDSGADATNHWLISPELPGTQQQISFYLRAITSRYG
ncbi:MAG: choice-of-anchor J domain-containing protein [Prevotella sp.]|nr:choice-of-anchor J domain-containing protein [Prevotella sp.]